MSEIRIHTGPFREHGTEPPLGELVEDVVRSAQDVVEQRVQLLFIEAEETLRRMALGASLVLVGSVFLGVVAAAAWIAMMGGVVWLTGERLGTPQMMAAIGVLHLALAVAAALAFRARSARREG